jgi:hypothetical protein
MIDVATVRDMLDFDPETGEFAWRRTHKINGRQWLPTRAGFLVYPRMATDGALGFTSPVTKR